MLRYIGRNRLEKTGWYLLRFEGQKTPDGRVNLAAAFM